MSIRILLFFTCFLSGIHCHGQSIFNGTLCNDEIGLRLHLDLDEESIEIPGMSFLGTTHGYLDGKTNNHVYGVWMLIRHKAKGKDKVELRFSNDTGSDSQTILLTALSDSTFLYEATGKNCVRKVVGRRLEKIPSSMELHKVRDKK